MTPVRFQCPECGAIITSKNAEAMVGKKVRCPKCTAVFRLPATDTDQPKEEDGAPPARSQRSSNVEPLERPSKSRVPADEEESPEREAPDDDDDRPKRRKSRDDERPKSKKKKAVADPGLFSKRNVIAMAIFSALAIVAVIIWDQQTKSESKPKSNDVVSYPDVDPPPPGEPGPRFPVPRGPIVGPRGKLPPVEDHETLVLREPHVPIASADPKDPTKIDEPDPTPLPKDLDPEAIDRVKRATVYVRVHRTDGSDASGTGFFEATSGLVITNAHVIDMLREDVAPKSIEVILHSGEGSKKELVLTADVVAVDRESDVAVLRPRMKGVNAKLPQGLTVTAGVNVKLLQPVFVFGFPLGEGLGKDITASATSVSSLRRDLDGNLAQIQVNGGMHSGNSGGPVVNTKGQAVGVAVAVIQGTQINFAIPGDRVHDLLRGRMDRLEVRTEKPRGKDIPVKVGVRSSDPLDRISKSGVDWWIANADMDVPPSLAAGIKLPANLTKQTLTLNYRGNGKVSEGEIVLSPPPLAGQVLWLQPWTMNQSGLAVYAAGLKYTVDVSPDPQPVTLKYAPPSGRQPLELVSKATFRLMGLGGDERSLRLSVLSKLNEEARERKPAGSTVTHYEVEKIDVNVVFDDRLAPPSPTIQRVSQHMGVAPLITEIDAAGGHVSSSLNIEKVPTDAQESITRFGDQIQKSLQVMMVSLPQGQIKPGHTWNAPTVVPSTGLTQFESGAIDMKFQYFGTRASINGKQVAVIEMTDRDGGTWARGKILVDVATGRVREGRFAIATESRLPLENDLLIARGVIEIQISRLRD